MVFLTMEFVSFDDLPSLLFQDEKLIYQLKLNTRSQEKKLLSSCYKMACEASVLGNIQPMACEAPVRGDIQRTGL